LAEVGDITGQTQLVVEVNNFLSSRDRPAIRLRGPSGSGKSWLTHRLVELWNTAGGIAFFAPGDELFARRPLFPLLLSVASETGGAHSKAITRLALEPLTAIPAAGKPIHELLQQLFERGDAEAAAKTPYLREEDREIFMRMQKAASRRRPLLVCDNLQWWDDASLETLAITFRAATKDAFPFLNKLAIVAVETTDAQGNESAKQRALFASAPWEAFDLSLCGEAAFSNLLTAFGVRSLPPEIVKHLFAVTGSHLELVRRIAEADGKNGRFWAATDSRAAFLFGLLEERLERHTAVPEETASVLRAASVIGSSFADDEIDCLTDNDADEVVRILEPAERLRILERSGRIRVFAHDLVRSYYLEHHKTRREELHRRFSECLRLLHCGDYARRAEHLRRSTNRQGASEVLVLEYLREMRAGTQPLIDGLLDELDDDLGSFAKKMHAAQKEFDLGQYRGAIDLLDGVERLYADVLLAERDILLARCHIKLLTGPDRDEAARILSGWDHLMDVENEVWGRAMLYLVVAHVFRGDEAHAKEAENALYRSLAKRVSFDSTARRSLNHLRLKSNMLHSTHVARERLQKAIEFFAGVGDGAVYDPIHQCIGLANLAANCLINGEPENAFSACSQANHVIQQEPAITFSRPDILATNLTLAAYLTGQLTLPEASEAAQSIWRTGCTSNDAPLLVSNIAYYLALEARHEEVVDRLTPLFADLRVISDLDSYYTYYVGNNLSGSLWMLGRGEESKHVWRSITPFVSDFIGPLALYIRRRHELQNEIFSGSPTQDWDGFLRSSTSPQVGPGWTFYGRGFLAAELEYWSDE
jgi:hypothetical protein